MRQGYFKQHLALKFPATLGGDFSGLVAALGEGVSNLKIGDAVYGRANVLAGGSFAEFTLAGVEALAYKPKKASHFQAAALPLAGLSAYQVIFDKIGLKAEQKILIHGAAGGIGSIAVQIAKYIGARVAATTGPNDINYVKDLGADVVIDYQSQNFAEVIKDYDAVFDNIGGEVYQKSFAVLKAGGIIVSMLEQPNTELMAKYGVQAKSQFTQPSSQHLAKLAELVDQGIIEITIDKVFSLDQAADALAYLEESHSRGKVVLQIK
jgi:NADPH:quinone reductase-like Zn-dependent oxidoreductase